MIYKIFMFTGYVMSQLGGAGDRFGDYLCVDCTNFTCTCEVVAINL